MTVALQAAWQLRKPLAFMMSWALSAIVAVLAIYEICTPEHWPKTEIPFVLLDIGFCYFILCAISGGAILKRILP